MHDLVGKPPPALPPVARLLVGDQDCRTPLEQLLHAAEDPAHAFVAAVDPAYPKELLPTKGVMIDRDTPLAPGETRIIKMDATDAAWEVERLVSFLSNVDSRIGALLFFYDDRGNRHINSVAGPILPVFKTTM